MNCNLGILGNFFNVPRKISNGQVFIMVHCRNYNVTQICILCAHCTIKLCMHFLNDTYKIFAYYNVRMMQQIQL